MRLLHLHVFVAFAAVACVARGQTTSIPVANSGFEAPAIPAGAFATTAPPPGWAGYGPLNFGFRTIGVLNPASTTLYAGPPPEGAQVGVVFLVDNPGNQLLFTGQEAGLSQTLGAVLQPGRRYVLRVEVGNIAVDFTPPNTFLFGGFPGYRIALQAGGVTIASDVNTLLPAEGGFLTSVIQVDIGVSHPQLGQPLRIRLGNLNAAVGIEVNFDDVRLESTPIATWTDLGFALGGAGGSPVLAGSGGLVAGAFNQIDLSNAPPFASTVLVVGLVATPQPILGGTLVPAPEVLIFLSADGLGTLDFSFVFPITLPTATMLFSQFWIADPSAPQGFSASNALIAAWP